MGSTECKVKHSDVAAPFLKLLTGAQQAAAAMQVMSVMQCHAVKLPAYPTEEMDLAISPIAQRQPHFP